MNRQFLIAPLILATTTAFSAHAASFGGGARTPGQGLSTAALPLLSSSGTADNSTALSNLRDRASSSADTSKSNHSDRITLRDLSAARTGRTADLPGLDGQASTDRMRSGPLKDDVPTITASSDGSGRTISRTLNVQTNDASVATTTRLATTGTPLSTTLQQVAAGNTRRIDNTATVKSSTQARAARTGANSSGQYALNNSYASTLGTTGTVTPKSASSPASSDISRSLSSSGTTGYSANRQTASMANSGTGKSSSASRTTDYGMDGASSTSRSGLKVTDASRNLQPTFTSSSSKSD